MKNVLRKLFCVCLLLCVLGVSSQAVFASQKININTATATELVVLKGVGEKTAANIVAYRKTHGDFKEIGEIVKVKGIGEKTFAKMAGQITVDEKIAKK